LKQQLARKAIRTVSAGVVAIAATIGLSLAVSAPAQAAVSAGSSCKLSANWTVKFSVNYTAIDATRETTHYLVMNSPGTIKKWRTTIFQIGTTAPQRLWGPLVYLNPDNLQRYNTTVTGLGLAVDMEVWGGNGHCQAVVSLS
jgi:hypothetical protein